jgi:4-carboxymuconolactone decarboxylase
MRIGLAEGSVGTPDQEEVLRAIRSGPRGEVPLPFRTMLDAPELAALLQAIGEYIRFSSSLAADVREAAILATAAAVGSGYEWGYHEREVRKLGFDDAVLRLAADPASIPASVVEVTHSARMIQDVVVFCAALATNAVDDAQVDRLTQTVGRRGVAELVCLCGYYTILAQFMAVAGVDTPCKLAPWSKPNAKAAS